MINIKDRQLNNLKLIQEILSMILDEPEMRFIQILWALGIIDREGDTLNIKDRFYEESEETFERVQRRRENEK